MSKGRFLYNSWGAQLIILRSILLFLVLATLVQCKTKSPSTEKNENVLRAPISRGSIRVLAELVEFIPGVGDSLCAENPCLAKIRIDKILDKGAVFGGSLETSQLQEVLFIGMLNGSIDINTSVPLKPGDLIQADIVFNRKSTQSTKYHVVGYSKL